MVTIKKKKELEILNKKTENITVYYLWIFVLALTNYHEEEMILNKIGWKEYFNSIKI